jgi:hypothetical protein
MREKLEPTSAGMIHGGVSERPVKAQRTTAEGRFIRRMVSREHTLNDQARNLRMAVSDSMSPPGSMPPAPRVATIS